MRSPLALLCVLLAAAAAAAADGNGSCSLTFVMAVTVRGCTLYAHQPSHLPPGNFLLEPAFCVATARPVADSSDGYDDLLHMRYLSFPLLVTDPSLALEAKEKLEEASGQLGLSVRSLKFMEVGGVRAQLSRASKFSSVTFLRSRGPAEGLLRLEFNATGCADCCGWASLPWQHQVSAFNGIELGAETRVAGCQWLRNSYPVTVANATDTAPLPRRNLSALLQCKELVFVKELQLRNCTSRLYARSDLADFYVLEPLMCYEGIHFIDADFQTGGFFLRLRLKLQDEDLRDAAKRSIRSLSPESVRFMRLWDAEAEGASNLPPRWQLERLRLTPDGTEAEMRVRCPDWQACRSLSASLELNPMNFWRHIQWKVTALIGGSCRHQFFGVRMRQASTVAPPTADFCSRNDPISWGLPTVKRQNRTFAVIQQRVSGSVNFQRKWDEYESGFGDQSNFWMGLKTIHDLTNPRPATLRVELKLASGSSYHGEWPNFTVAGAADNFRLRLGAMLPSSSSFPQDALTYHNGCQFSTLDRDNDHKKDKDCSRISGNAGWWFQGCHYANPNGIYNASHAGGMEVATWLINNRQGFQKLKLLLQL